MTAPLEIVIPPQAAPSPSRAPLPWLQWGLLAACGALAFNPISVTWNANANYSFGWWIPVVCLYLLYERWPSRPARQESSQLRLGAPIFISLGLLYLALRLAAEADPDWRPGLWVISGLYVGAILLWLWLYGGKPWLRHFAFPVCFLFLALPWPFELEGPLVQGLMRWNALLASGSLRLLGTPAEAQGNIIQLANCRLGVEEACSGILSLQSSVMVGCLLGELYRLSLVRRGTLVLLTMALALVGNYSRTLALSLLASFHGSDAVARWHDTAGYSILIFTAIGSWIVCLALRYQNANAFLEMESEDDIDPEPTPAPPPAAKPAPRLDPDLPASTHRAWSFTLQVFAVMLLAELLTQGWFGYHELSMARHPSWGVHFPDQAQRTIISPTTLGVLFCDDGQAANWKDARGLTWNSFWFYYKSKPSNRVVLAWHNPDNCLPSVGLKKVCEYPDFTATCNGLSFLVQPKQFAAHDQTIFLFWVVYPLSGELPRHIENNSTAPVDSKFRNHLAEVVHGYRGVGVETLETGLSGAATYDEAKAAYLEMLKNLVTPENLAPAPAR